MNDVGADQNTFPEPVGKVNLPVEAIPKPIEPPVDLDTPVVVRNEELPRSKLGLSDVLLGVVAIVVMVGAAVIILQGVFQIMPA